MPSAFTLASARVNTVRASLACLAEAPLKASASARSSGSVNSKGTTRATTASAELAKASKRCLCLAASQSINTSLPGSFASPNKDTSSEFCFIKAVAMVTVEDKASPRWFKDHKKPPETAPTKTQATALPNKRLRMRKDLPSRRAIAIRSTTPPSPHPQKKRGKHRHLQKANK
jgi:hypothetical protein